MGMVLVQALEGNSFRKTTDQIVPMEARSKSLLSE